MIWTMSACADCAVGDIAGERPDHCHSTSNCDSFLTYDNITVVRTDIIMNTTTLNNPSFSSSVDSRQGLNV